MFDPSSGKFCPRTSENDPLGLQLQQPKAPLSLAESFRQDVSIGISQLHLEGDLISSHRLGTGYGNPKKDTKVIPHYFRIGIYQLLSVWGLP